VRGCRFFVDCKSAAKRFFSVIGFLARNIKTRQAQVCLDSLRIERNGFFEQCGDFARRGVFDRHHARLQNVTFDVIRVGGENFLN
jgi:hypothetical protein